MTPEAQINLAQQIIKDHLSVREAERLVQMHAEARNPGKRTPRVRLRSDLEERLQKRFGTRVDIEKHRRGGKIIIHYFSPEELGGVVERLLN
jgi:ParB family chromosome partitioning protein